MQLSCSLLRAAEVTGKLASAGAAKAMRMVGLAKKEDDEEEEEEEFSIYSYFSGIMCTPEQASD